jgi:hypothetical protein
MIDFEELGIVRNGHSGNHDRAGLDSVEKRAAAAGGAAAGFEEAVVAMASAPHVPSVEAGNANRKA